MKKAVFTIASRNYFACVNTLMQSLESSNPDLERYVVCVDEISPDFAALPKNYELISLDDLKLPHKEQMIFRYTILEFNTAVKPFAIERLFERGYDRVIYLDPDIYVYEQFEELDGEFARGAEFVLTPHYTHLWKEDGKKPGESDIMVAGVYNLGFIALANTADTLEMVRWWQRKLEFQCVIALDKGIFVDQKWMDLVPGLFPHVAILRHDGCNVAYWNLSHRTAEKKDGKYFFNGQRLVFFHYSGLNVDDPEALSKHQDRFTLSKIGVARELVLEYAEKLRGNSSARFAGFQYAYNRFSDGRPIPDDFRIYYRSTPIIQKACGENPFEASEVFYRTFRQEYLKWLLGRVWDSRPDVRIFFHHIPGSGFLNWARSELKLEDDLSFMLDENGSDGKVCCMAGAESGSFREWLKGIRMFISPGTYRFGKRLYHIFKH